MDSQQQSARSSHVTEIVAIFLGVTQQKQKALMDPLGLSESQVSRKVKAGAWSVDDVDRLAQFFGVAVSDFFEDPEVIRRRTLGGSEVRWTTTPTDGSEMSVLVTQCVGQEALALEETEQLALAS